MLIDVRAAGINFADLMARLGLYPDAPKPPCVIGYEVAGTSRGPRRRRRPTSSRSAQRVVAPARFGGYAELAVGAWPMASSRSLRRMSFEEGAADPDHLRHRVGGAHPRSATCSRGERVLIQAAAGGVGIAATQIAKRAGAEVWGTASPGKHDAIRGFGVDHPLDYTRPGWERTVPKLDVVMDAIGGASFRRSYKLLQGGRTARLFRRFGHRLG